MWVYIYKQTFMLDVINQFDSAKKIWFVQNHSWFVQVTITGLLVWNVFSVYVSWAQG